MPCLKSSPRKSLPRKNNDAVITECFLGFPRSTLPDHGGKRVGFPNQWMSPMNVPKSKGCIRNSAQGWKQMQRFLAWNVCQFPVWDQMLVVSHLSLSHQHRWETTMMACCGHSMPSWWRGGADHWLPCQWCFVHTKSHHSYRHGSFSTLFWKFDANSSFTLTDCCFSFSCRLGHKSCKSSFGGIHTSSTRPQFDVDWFFISPRSFRTCHANVCVVAGKSDPGQLISQNRCTCGCKTC